MSKLGSILVLLAAAFLEAGGDAIVRAGVHAQAWRRVLWFALGAIVLFTYGWTVNAPPWNFGRLLGLYVVFFFVIAQALSWVVFGEAPPRAVLMSGAFIVVGGWIIAVAQ